jgi:hypothetical protein
MEQQRPESAFQPKGAIAFFIAMMAFYAALWLVFYFILVGRR